MAKKKLFLTLPIALAPFAIVSCSSNNDDSSHNENDSNNQNPGDGNTNKPTPQQDPQPQPEPTPPVDNDFSKHIEEMLNSNVIAFRWKNPIISKKYFDEYKDNVQEMYYAISFENNSNELLNYQIEKINETEGNIQFKIRIYNSNNSCIKTIKLSKNFNSDQKYVDGIFTQLLETTKLKDEFSNWKLINLFNKYDSLELFITSCLNIEKFVGIKIIPTIPSQVIDFKSQIDNNQSHFKINFIIKDKATNSQLIPNNINQFYLPLKNSQITLTTILKQSDLNNNRDLINDVINNKTLGKIFIFKDENNSNLEINNDFSGKGIVGEISFEKFNTITFGQISNFSNNKISSITFNNNGALINLKSNLFTNNLISSLQLPKNVSSFNIGAFDSGVAIKGIQNIDLMQRVYDFQSNDLHLERANDANEINSIFNLIKGLQQRSYLSINNIYLPAFKFVAPTNVTCNNIIFNSTFNNEVHNEIFETNLSTWNIQNNIQIPSSVVSINKKLLPNNIEIYRELNENTVRLINNYELNLNQDLFFTGLNKIYLFDYIDKLDDLFFTFNTNNQTINSLNKILISNKGGGIWNNKNIIDSISFFKNNEANNKQIIIDKRFNSITSHSNFYALKNGLKNLNVSVIREMNDNFSFINNNELNLLSFYQYLDENNITNNISTILVGYEDLFNSINTTGIDYIKDNLFNNIQFKKNTTINLERIKIVKSRGFSNCSYLLYDVTNFLPTSIGDFAFDNQKISNRINLANVESIGAYAFRNSDIIGNINLLNATKIGAYAFYGNSKLTNVELSEQLTMIDSYVFYGCSLESIDLKNVRTIKNNAFYNNKLTGNINLANVESIGAYAFYGNSKLTNVELSEQLTMIDSYVFYGCSLELIDLKNVNYINSYAFGNNKLTSLDLTNVRTIKNNAFFGNEIATVTNFNFDNNMGVEQIFSNYKNINFNNLNDLYTVLRFDNQNKILDWSSLTIMDNKFINYSNYFFKKERIQFNEIILPSVETIDPKIINWIKSAELIKKLTWNSNSKIMNFNFMNLRNIESLNQNFVLGMDEIPENAFKNMSLRGSTTINLVNIKKVGSNAFYRSGFKVFTNTESLKEINSFSFDNDVTMTIGPNVKIAENAFSQNNFLPSTVSRPRIFTNHYSEIYDQESKILDFTKAKININNYNSEQVWAKYKNINQYLLYGDVKKIVLPPLYILRNGFVNDLGVVNEIKFQWQNQEIFLDTFKNTTITNKPRQEETNIIFDEDNFFDVIDR